MARSFFFFWEKMNKQYERSDCIFLIVPYASLQADTHDCHKFNNDKWTFELKALKSIESSPLYANCRRFSLTMPKMYSKVRLLLTVFNEAT